MRESFLATLGVAGEAALAYALLAAAFSGRGLRLPRLVLAAALGTGVAIGVAAGLHPAGRSTPVALEPLRGVLAVVLIAAAGATSGLHREGPPRARWAGRWVETLVLAVATALEVPEAAALAGKLSEAAVLAQAAAPVAAAALGALVLAAAAGAALERLLVRTGVAAAIVPAAALAGVFALKVAGVAAASAGQPTAAVALADALGRGVHDSVHVGFVIFQLPDHPFLRDEVYQLTLLALEPRVHAILAAAVAAVPIAFALRSFLRRPAPLLPEDARAPDRRRARAAHARSSRVGGAAFVLALGVATSAIAAAPVSQDDFYDPVPEPVVDDGRGEVVIPLATSRAADGRMRKWSYGTTGRAIVFLTVRRPDGTLAVTLDACAVCQPKGYSQLGREFVYCKYCKTPIPLSTVGQAGGCNPIPVSGAHVVAGALRVPIAELVAATAHVPGAGGP